MITRLGKYEIQAELGHGAFGRVFRAYDPSVGRLVAVKIMTHAGDRDLLTRFRNEAAAAGNLRHKNIVTIYEFGEENNVPYIAMEYLEGEDLQHMIAGGKALTLMHKVQILAQVAEGLYCAHQAGVVHRDVKPANIMRLADGTVKIMDFGIARLTRDDATRLTQKGDMIGTILYMSPEQFRSSVEVDAICDIFAYGVICYELLGGKHPFKADDAGTVMYRITSEDPPPLRTLAPECPEALEQIVHRALSKERELRYQSLEDALLDLGPILTALQQARAGVLLEQARERFQKEQWEAARSVVREVLELDPPNREARQLREAIQQQVQKQVVAPRVQSLLEKAEQQLVGRQFNDAIESFESAWRLDRNNAEIRSRIDQVRGRLEHSKRAARLVAEAKREFRQQELTLANRNLTEALEADPDNPEAVKLLQTIQQERERREAEKKFQDDLARAKDLLAAHCFDESIALLAQLEARQPGSSQVAQLLARARTQKAMEERRQRRQSEIASVRQWLQEGRFPEAIERLEALRRDYPEDEELVNLLAYGQEKLRGQQRAQAVQAMVGEANERSQAGDFEHAIQLVRRGLGSYPGEPELVGALESLMAAHARQKRREGVDAALRQAQQLRAQRQFWEALEALAEARAAYGEEEALAGLRQQLEQEWEQQKRAEALQAAVDRGRTLLQEGRFEEAVEELAKSVAVYPEVPQLASLTAEARQKLQAHRQARAVDKVADEALALSRAGRLEQAAQVLQQGLQSYPEQPNLARLLETVVSARSSQERDQAAARAVEQCEQWRREGRWSEALELAQASLRQYGHDPRLVELETQIRQQWERQQRAEAARQAVEAARQLLYAGRVEEAVQALERDCSLYPGEPEVASALAEARQKHQARERGQALTQTQQQCEQLRRQGRLEEAIQLVEAAFRRWGGDPALLETRTVLGQELVQHQRAEAARKALEKLQRLLDRSGPELAISAIEQAAAQYPEEARLGELLARSRQQLEALMRSRAIEELAARALALHQAQDFSGAISALEQGLRTFPGEPRLEELLEQTRAALAAEEREGAVAAALAHCEQLRWGKRFAEALEVVEAARRDFPQEPRLVALEQRLREESEQHRRAEAVRRALGEARRLLNRGHDAEAVSVLEWACEQYPGETEPAALLASARQAVQARQRQQAIEQARAEAEALAEAGDFDGAIRGLEEALLSYPEETSFRQLLEAQRRAKLVEETQAAPPPEPAPQPPGPEPIPWWRRRVVQLGAAGAVVLLVGLLAVPKLWKPSLKSQAFQVEVRRSPGGATVQILDQSCQTPECRFQLAAGAYQATARAAGYRELQHSFKVEAAGAIHLKLEPLPEQLWVQSELGGKAWLDGQFVGDLQRGAVVKGDVAEGRHSLRLAVRDGEALIHFRSAPGRPPELTSPLSAKALQAIVIGSIGSRARLDCTCGPLPVSLDGRLLGDLTQAGLALPEVSEGRHRLRVGQRDLDLTAGAAPGLSVFLFDTGSAAGKPGAGAQAPQPPQKKELAQVRVPTQGETAVPPPGPAATPATLPAEKVLSPPAPPARKRVTLEEYGGLNAGTLRWTGQLRPGGVLEIRDHQASIGNLAGDWLPGDGLAVTVEMAPSAGLALERPPSEANLYSGMTIRNSGPNPVTAIRILWKIRR